MKKKMSKKMLMFISSKNFYTTVSGKLSIKENLFPDSTITIFSWPKVKHRTLISMKKTQEKSQEVIKKC